MASYGEDYDAIAAYEDEDDYVMVFASAPSRSAGGAAASSPDVLAEEEEQIPPLPLGLSGAASSPACDERDMVEMAVAAAEALEDGAVAAPPPPPPPPTPASAARSYEKDARGAAYAGADEEDEDGTDEEEEEDEEDEDDYMYQSYYDRADHGRSRHVKRSSGRRGRTKKASTMGRPRGEGHLAQSAGAHAYAY